MTVFIKRYPRKGELPKVNGEIILTNYGILTYSKTFGWVNLQNYTTKSPRYWLEEIELPSEEGIENESYKGWVSSHFKAGASFILNHIKK